MRKLLYILMALAVFAGCKKNGNEEKPKDLSEIIVGEWHCSPSDIQADIYIAFTNGSFELYQKITQGSFRLYRGTWSLNGTELSGRYNDGTSWAARYDVTASDDGNSMTFEAEGVVYIYSRSAIPSEVKEDCIVEVKSSALF